MRASTAVIAIATVLLIGSILIPAGGFYFMFLNPSLRDFLWPVIGIQIAFSLLGIITSIGLVRLHEAARKAVIFLATAPLCILVLGLFVLVAAARSTHNFFFVGAFLIFGALLVILTPISIWWLVVLRRDDVRSQFR